MGPRLAAQGTLTRGAIDLGHGPMAPRVEVPCAASQDPLRRKLMSPMILPEIYWTNRVKKIVLNPDIPQCD